MLKCYREKSGKSAREGWSGVAFSNRVVREGISESWHLSKDLKEMSSAEIWEKIFPGRGIVHEKALRQEGTWCA